MRKCMENSRKCRKLGVLELRVQGQGGGKWARRNKALSGSKKSPVLR